MIRRIARIRKDHLKHPKNLDIYRLYRAEGASRFTGTSLMRQSAFATEHMLRNVPIMIEQDELIVGSAGDELDENQKKRWQKLQPWHNFMNKDGRGGITAHLALDYEMVLREGLRNIRKRIEEKLKSCKKTTPEVLRRREFYESAIQVLSAVNMFAKRHALQAEFLSRFPSYLQLRELEYEKIESVCRRVPEYPARDFQEALQSVYFIFTVATAEAGLMSLGRPDQYLWPYYHNDIASGVLTRKEALELIECFFIKLNEWYPLPQSMMIGGQNSDGECAVNELSYLFLDAMEDVRMINPALGAAIGENTPDEFIERCAELNCKGISFPALFNDNTIIPGLVRAGVAREDARRYVHCTCTEITPEASSGIWVVADYINFAKCLEAALAENHADFAALASAVKAHLAAAIKSNCEQQNIFAEARKAGGRYPFISSLINDCVEKGLDLDEGGARYYFFYPQLVGLATVADSLAAIRELVFERGELSLNDLRRYLAEDYEGTEDVRQRLLKKYPKYGNDMESPDALAVDLANFYMDEVEKYENPYGFRYHPGFLSWIQHVELGRQTGATPDGRTAGKPLADSLAAAQGRAANGPTAVLRSVEKLDLSRAIGAAVVNLTFPDDTLAGEDGPKLLASMIKSHFSRGGFEVQINVVSREKLLAAQDDPDSYRNLMVRVGGYSDYFTRLSRAAQDEIIDRTE